MKRQRLSRRDWLVRSGGSCLTLAGMGWLAGCGQVRSTRTVRAGEVDKKPAPLTTDMSDTWPLFRGQPTCVGLAGCQLPDKPEVV
ncbi:MAG TPA: hypothetical protein VGX78_15945, partial [Pirellulales bacterium]|nr:hypothetical protein [Pirellulales bacterium]